MRASAPARPHEPEAQRDQHAHQGDRTPRLRAGDDHVDASGRDRLRRHGEGRRRARQDARRGGAHAGPARADGGARRVRGRDEAQELKSGDRVTLDFVLRAKGCDVSLSATPPDARASLDGAEPVPVPTQARVAVGEHTVTFAAAGFESKVVPFACDGTKPVPLEAKLVSVVPLGRVKVPSSPGTVIAIDGRVLSAEETVAGVTLTGRASRGHLHAREQASDHEGRLRRGKRRGRRRGAHGHTRASKPTPPPPRAWASPRSESTAALRAAETSRSSNGTSAPIRRAPIRRRRRPPACASASS